MINRLMTIIAINALIDSVCHSAV